MRCIECFEPLPYIFSKYTNGDNDIKICICGKPCDRYFELRPIVFILDLLLLKKRALIHIIHNKKDTIIFNYLPIFSVFYPILFLQLLFIFIIFKFYFNISYRIFAISSFYIFLVLFTDGFIVTILIISTQTKTLNLIKNNNYYLAVVFIHVLTYFMANFINKILLI
ncbi:Arv1-like protein [Spraguea lophii 42_110]|uniref:Protein ARV n=1 Tax=Spraguea lophii (strain 42_110) TaxID=1358809 RepID=S7WB97_SPRLO|nr:Arv1-like protein [Spraguea lophii 42_110]